MPIQREKDRNAAADIKLGYGMLGLCFVLYAFFSHPYFLPGTYPELSQLTVAEGILIRHPVQRDAKYVTEPVGLRTDRGDIFKKCANLGVRCLAGPNEPKVWRHYLGKPARMWFWGEWMFQLEIDGVIHPRLSYARRKEFYTSLPGWFWLACLAGGYTMFRLIQRYGRAAANEVFSTIKTLNPRTGDGK